MFIFKEFHKIKVSFYDLLSFQSEWLAIFSYNYIEELIWLNPFILNILSFVLNVKLNIINYAWLRMMM